MTNYLYLDRWTKELLREVYYRTEHNQPDYSVEFAESIEITTCELAEKLVTDYTESGEDVTKISIDKSAQDFLIEVHKHHENSDGMLFGSLEMSEAMESFLYLLGKYLVKGDYNEPFAIDSK